jgi:hypothetical protein
MQDQHKLPRSKRQTHFFINTTYTPPRLSPPTPHPHPPLNNNPKRTHSEDETHRK